jgi:hypothetical protein
VRFRYAPIAGVVACFVAGLVLLLFGIDASRWSDALASGDLRYRGAPEGELWQPDQLVPGGLVRGTLGIQDDLAYRRAFRAFRLAHPEVPGVTDPTRIVFRNVATSELTEIALHGNDLHRRAAAANLLGVLSYSDALYDYAHQERWLANAARRFQQAIGFDPDNADAKYNLELTLTRARAIKFAEGGGGANPTPGGKGSKGAGAGEPGSGY